MQHLNLNESLAYLQKLKQTYLNRRDYDLYRFGLMHPLQIIAEKYSSNMEHRKALKYLEEIFELIKDYNDFQALLTLKEMVECYRNMNKNIDICQKKAMDYFKSMHFSKTFYEAIWQRLSLKF